MGYLEKDITFRPQLGEIAYKANDDDLSITATDHREVDDVMYFGAYFVHEKKAPKNVTASFHEDTTTFKGRGAKQAYEIAKKRMQQKFGPPKP